MFNFSILEFCTHDVLLNFFTTVLSDLIGVNDKSTTVATRASFDPCLSRVPQ